MNPEDLMIDDIDAVDEITEDDADICDGDEFDPDRIVQIMPPRGEIVVWKDDRGAYYRDNIVAWGLTAGGQVVPIMNYTDYGAAPVDFDDDDIIGVYSSVGAWNASDESDECGVTFDDGTE